MLFALPANWSASAKCEDLIRLLVQPDVQLAGETRPRLSPLIARTLPGSGFAAFDAIVARYTDEMFVSSAGTASVGGEAKIEPRIHEHEAINSSAGDFALVLIDLLFRAKPASRDVVTPTGLEPVFSP